MPNKTKSHARANHQPWVVHENRLNNLSKRQVELERQAKGINLLLDGLEKAKDQLATFNQHTIHAAVEIGIRLIVVKSVKPGEFMAWCHQNCKRLKDRAINYYMKLAKKYRALKADQKVALNDKTLTEAMIILGVRQPKTSSKAHLAALAKDELGMNRLLAIDAKLPNLAERLLYWQSIVAQAQEHLDALRKGEPGNTIVAEPATGTSALAPTLVEQSFRVPEPAGVSD